MYGSSSAGDAPGNGDGSVPENPERMEPYLELPMRTTGVTREEMTRHNEVKQNKEVYERLELEIKCR